MLKLGRRKLTPIACWVATLALVVVALIIALRGGATEGNDSGGPALVLIELTFATVGLMLLLKVPGNRIGWTFSIGGLLAAVWVTTQTYFEAAKLNGWPGIGFVAWLNFAVYFPMILCLVAVPLLLFPDGEVPSRGWRWVWWPIVMVALLAVVSTTLQPEFTEQEARVVTYRVANPMGVEAAGRVLESTAISALGALLIVVSLLAPAAAMVYRIRRSKGVERLQLKWLAISASFAGLGLAFYYTVQQWVPESSLLLQVVLVVALIGVLGIPVTAGVAITRYRLYDIDRLISRTISYGLLVGLLGAVYVLAVFLLGSLPFEGQIPVALSTLVVAALFSPLRRRLQELLDRRFSRTAYTSQAVIDDFSRLIRDEIDVDSLLEDLLGVVDATVAPVGRAVWVRHRGDPV